MHIDVARAKTPFIIDQSSTGISVSAQQALDSSCNGYVPGCDQPEVASILDRNSVGDSADVVDVDQPAVRWRIHLVDELDARLLCDVTDGPGV